ncbi:MAG TPA: preprotein translocase subunit SecA [Chloroflexia bacterium]|nr:preprotein translocase subunit SecA [Chloroflexia bacterium]
MFKGLKNLITGGGNEAEVRRLEVVAKRIIDELGPKFSNLSDEQLAAKTEDFKARLAEGEKLDALLPEAFAAVRESAWRTRKQKHYKVQLIGGMVLHHGKIAEMRTGEGKTMVATLAAYLNALTGKGVHVVTVNDYLARRDAQWMGPIYKKLGLSVAVIQSNGGNPMNPDAYVLDFDYTNPDPNMRHLRPVSRHEAYLADITHGTNNEFGFDYLRDNMATDVERLSQRELHFAIVDEVDNILIDEARTPLIISGQGQKAQDDYVRFADIVRQLRKGPPPEDAKDFNFRPNYDYWVDEKKRVVTITERGIERVERILSIAETESIYDDKWSHLVPYLENALKAKELYLRDREYVVRNNEEVIIVDEFTGRLQEGRRWEGGLHQAIEAKEGVHIQHENMTYATITLQNYFRMYKKLAGMTGTAATEAEEFQKIYGLDVVVIPTNREMIRKDFTDLIYKNEPAKFRAVVEEIVEMFEMGRPVLVGTVSVEKSEELSEMLKHEGIQHNVLNAKLHEREAGIVAQAGRPGAVTIATNMAGRGTDIILGGSPESYLEEELQARGLTEADRGTEAYQEAEEAAEQRWQEAHDKVLELGGLHIIGTERHESRRIDNQLRGRAGRQGDPGSSRFYVSLEDELMRRFGSERIGGLLERFGFDEETAIENSMITRSIEQAQTKVEGQNFDYRKHLVEYDDVMNKQRAIIYEDRRKVLSGESQRDRVLDLTDQRISEIVDEYTQGNEEEWDLPRLLRNVGLILQTKALELSRRPENEEDMEDLVLEALEDQLGVTLEELEGKNQDELKDFFADVAARIYDQKLERVGEEDMQLIERLVMLEVIDRNWVNYLTPMEELRQGIGLRAYGQQDPLQAYRKAAFSMWNDLQTDIRREIVQKFWSAEIQRTAPTPPPVMATNLTESGPGEPAGDNAPVKKQPAKSSKLNPNAPCFCGSGKKYKKCHGRVV